ncbi:Rieske 2Fe-2S domain-containing protein [Leptolyngbya sp. AN03gr2]|uniref:aromatic ring-hydroxylating dioxygenase subunit alpha n=1 Tax=unclassified Leptolyngbya TaxID=2650499 RepID=UPI003D31B894
MLELATTLQGQTIQNRVREVGINPNHWYAVAWAHDLKPGKILPIRIWSQQIALYRDSQNQVQAVENVCPHKGVAMDKGKVQGDAIVCGYHGWEFNGQGECVGIPYWNEGQKLPCAKIQSYPVQEKYGLIWLFPGDRDFAELASVPDIPEYDDPTCFMVPIAAKFKAHFSICNENTMDVFHGYLHQNLQGWFDPVLTKLRETEDSVKAEYQVSYKGVLTKFIGLSESGGITTKTISVDYQYPNYINKLEGISALYLMRLPISETESRSFAMLFLRLPIPVWLINLVRRPLQPVILHLLFLPFLHQDIEMIESEQENYLKNPSRRYVEVNPAIIAVQRLIVKQFDRYQQSLQRSEMIRQ